MPEVVNTSFLGDVPENEADANANAETMIKVDNVSMVFNMASETMTNLKEYAIALARRELHFKEFRALDHISLEVKKGDVFGILGTNGSGKSTLLKIIAGVLEPTEGTCTVHGSIAPLIELGAGFDMELTARENIYLNGALLGYPKKFIDQHFDEIVDFAEVEQFLDMPLKNYSSGMVARIAFAIATVIIPDILIVDEVLSVGDFMFQQKCERRINALIKEHGVTVLIVSHSNEQIERLCNKAIWIEKGHERIQGNAQEVCQVYRMLGGHFGSPEAEQRIFDLVTEPAPSNTDLLETIAGDDRFGTSVKLAQATIDAKPQTSTKDLILLACEDLSSALLANSLAGALNTLVLTTKPDSIPDVTAQFIRASSPSTLYLVSNDAITPELSDAVAAICPTASIRTVTNQSISELSRSIYNIPDHSAWGKTAILCHEEGRYDLFTLVPYLYEQHAPVFIVDDTNSLADTVQSALSSSSIEQLLVLGDEATFSNDILAPYTQQGLSITRFCGKNYYDANARINAWLNSSRKSPSKIMIFVSVWQPLDALSIGSFAAINEAEIVLLDPRDLDCITSILTQIDNNKSSLQKLIFIGGDCYLEDYYKALFLKATAN